MIRRWRCSGVRRQHPETLSRQRNELLRYGVYITGKIFDHKHFPSTHASTSLAVNLLPMKEIFS
jgi:hypothetical protein